MAKRDRDAVLRELVHSVNESDQTAVPLTVTARGAVLHGFLISQDRYFAELVQGVPLMGALCPGAGLLGEGYAKDVSAGADHFLHLRAASLGGDHDAEGLWRISLDAIDAWTLSPAPETSGQEDKGPFARLLSSP
jgi:hypothetical protein